MPGRAKGPKRKDARTKIIEAAEKLYARNGIDAVSIRQINSEAGQRNGSAVHYYFGNRDGLLDAIFEHRMAPLNTHRLLLLDTLKDASPDKIPAIEKVVEAMVRPAFEGMSLGKVTYWRRFLYHMQSKLRLMDQIMSRRYDLGLRECFRLIRWQMPDVPSPITYHRYVHAVSLIVDSASNLEEMLENEPDKVGQNRMDLHIECTVDSVCGVFLAPISGRAHDMGLLEAERGKARRQAAAEQTAS